MKKITIIFLLICGFTHSQVNIEESGNWNIKGGATLNVAGLEINPESDYVLAGPNSVEMSLTSISIAGSEIYGKTLYCITKLTIFFRGFGLQS